MKTIANVKSKVASAVIDTMRDERTMKGGASLSDPDRNDMCNVTFMNDEEAVAFEKEYNEYLIPVNGEAPMHQINYRLSKREMFRSGYIQAIYSYTLHIPHITGYNLYDDSKTYIKSYSAKEAEHKKATGEFTEYQNLAKVPIPATPFKIVFEAFHKGSGKWMIGTVTREDTVIGIRYYVVSGKVKGEMRTSELQDKLDNEEYLLLTN